QGAVSLADHDPGDTSGFDGSKKQAEKSLAQLGDELSDLQERMYADAYVGGSRRVLVVLQGMDTSGKGGVIDHVFGLLKPHGLRLKTFKKPTKEELANDFLWRIEKALPERGLVGVFDRSHYEDVLIARVHALAEEKEIERRYGAINDFEKRLVDDSTVVIKCMLHVSPEKQQERLQARLDDPEKQWKFKPEDVDERALWRDYQKAYEIALARCNADAAPWYVVPSDHKWYRNWAVAQLLLEALRGMKLEWPKPTYDVEEQRRRLLGENPEETVRP
ncbi:MAG: phosphate--nucleotide phosphotransferase, partial [Marmoricola sp.]|nr:phosphate--nucleotide phosphotransferase [Marmoricola sp.]